MTIFNFFLIGVVEDTLTIDFCTFNEVNGNDDDDFYGALAFEISPNYLYLHFMGIDLLRVGH